MERLKYRRVSVSIKCGDGERKVKAYELTPASGGLVAHKRVGNNRWVITHKPSGLLVSYYSYDTLQEALQKIKRLIELARERGFSWDDSEEKLKGMGSSLVMEVEKALREY